MLVQTTALWGSCAVLMRRPVSAAKGDRHNFRRVVIMQSLIWDQISELYLRPQSNVQMCANMQNKAFHTVVRLYDVF